MPSVERSRREQLRQMGGAEGVLKVVKRKIACVLPSEALHHGRIALTPARMHAKLNDETTHSKNDVEATIQEVAQEYIDEYFLHEDMKADVKRRAEQAKAVADEIYNRERAAALVALGERVLDGGDVEEAKAEARARIDVADAKRRGNA